MLQWILYLYVKYVMKKQQYNVNWQKWNDTHSHEMAVVYAIVHSKTVSYEISPFPINNILQLNSYLHEEAFTVYVDT